jgi:hypothetical protein
MSQNISKVFVIDFDKDVKQEYSAQPGLRSTVRLKTNVEGKEVEFKRMGQGIATKKVPQADVTLMNIDYTPVTAHIEDYAAAEMDDIFDLQKINHEDRSELVSICGKAIARREDQTIINAINAAATTNIVPADFDTGTPSQMSTAKFRDARRLARKASVNNELTMIINADAEFSMLGDDNADTFDKNAVKALVNAEFTKWLGFNIKTIGDMNAEGGLPYDTVTAQFTALAYDRMAVGLAIGIDMRTEINYIPMKTSWLINAIWSGGAVTIDPVGVIKVNYII